MSTMSKTIAKKQTDKLTLAEVIREMEKPRMAESARKQGLAIQLEAEADSAREADRCPLPHMGNPELISRFLREHPTAAYCDACLADNLMLVSRRQAQHVITELVSGGSFVRKSGKCRECAEIRIVTQA
jgi:hypothetical protein